jgi:hypothetical protein
MANRLKAAQGFWLFASPYSRFAEPKLSELTQH